MDFKLFSHCRKCSLKANSKLKLNKCWSFVFSALLIISCSNENKYVKTIKEIIFLPEIHISDGIFTADSLLFYGIDSLAIKYFENEVNNKTNNKIQQYYIRSKLLNLIQDSIWESELYTQIAGKDSLHPVIYLEMTAFQLKNRKPIQNLNTIREVLDSDVSAYYKGKAAYSIAKHYDEIEPDGDSAWHYYLISDHHFKMTGYITPLHQTCLEKICVHATYQRKNLAAIRFANAMFDFDKYFPKMDSADMARAYANRAFMMFREGDFQGTIDDIESGLKLIKPNRNPEIFQNLMKSYLVLYMIHGQDSLWHDVAEKIDKNITEVGVDYIEMNRWRGQHYTETGRYDKAIHHLNKALSKEILFGVKYNAKLSTLCTLLSLCYENTGKYDMALNYMALNAWSTPEFDLKKMSDYIFGNRKFTFYIALRCAQIYYTDYQKNKNKQALTHTKQLLSHVDDVMYRQFKVSDESAILQFYQESGQEFFHLGMKIAYDLWKAYRKPEHLESFVQYSEKNRNSLMYRDRLMASKETKLPDNLIYREMAIRSSLKAEQQRGYRSNKIFNQWVDEYMLIEKEISQKHSGFLDNSLMLGLENIKTIQAKLPDHKTSIFLIDEVEDEWYFTLIKKEQIVLEKRKYAHNDLDKLDTLISVLKGDIPLSENELGNLSKKIRKDIFPTSILEHLTKNLIFITDGIFNRVPMSGFFVSDTLINITQAPSIRMIEVKPSKSDIKKKGVAIFAFSDQETIKSKNRTYLTELPGTYKEALQIQKKYPDALVYTGHKATKENFIKVYQDPEIHYIHIAVHGLANSAEKDDVKLYFRTSSGGLDSLYGFELLRYKSKANKIVLSACQSGVGSYVKGEGNYSLPRYFMINGADEVEASLWDVDDTKHQDNMLRLKNVIFF